MVSCPDTDIDPKNLYDTLFCYLQSCGFIVPFSTLGSTESVL